MNEHPNVVADGDVVVTNLLDHGGELDRRDHLQFFGIYSGDLAAGFIADEIEICSNGIVNYTDISTGNIISWMLYGK